MNFINIDADDLDRHIYRIMPEPFVLALFQQRENVLSSIHNWKDKFENFQLKLGGILNGETFSYAFSDDFFGQCWTRHNLSEAMWGIYANDPDQRYLRIRSTPRKLLEALTVAHPQMPQDTCFVGRVTYETEAAIKNLLVNEGEINLSPIHFAKMLLVKRRAFKHENEVRLIYFGEAVRPSEPGLYRYGVNPHQMITQIMADPNRDRRNWKADRAAIKNTTGFAGDIKRSKVYDPPEWDIPSYRAVV